MNKLFVRLAASGAIAAGMGATALADSASISTTGPGSTNVITSTTRNTVCNDIVNRVGVGNWNNQSARTGNVWVAGNTRVEGDGTGSGSASNTNWGQNDVNIANNGNSVPANFGENSDGNANIYLTGPNSNNRISSNNSNRFSNNTVNNVSATNSNDQQARSGQVVISGNTVVEGVAGSGDATNSNTGVNNVELDNTSNVPSDISDGSGNNNASIDTTGPGSNNQIKNNTRNSFSQNTVNNVSANNSSEQTATSGNVIITGNTVVKGVGGSGNASNDNQTENDVNVNNN